MRKVICDRCNTELIDSNQVVVIHANPQSFGDKDDPFKDHKHYDLCPNCWEYLEGEINGHAD